MNSNSAFRVLALAMSCAFGVAWAATVQPPFDADYQIYAISMPNQPGNAPVPGVPGRYAAIAFRPGDPSTLLLGSDVYASSATLYAVGVIRDAGHHVVGIAGNAAQVMAAPGLPGGAGIGSGIGFGAGGVMLYTSVYDNSLSMVKPGSTTPDRQIDLSTLSPVPISGANPLAIVPIGFPGAGRMKLADGSGEFFDATLAPDAAGTFDVASVLHVGKLAGTGPDGVGNTNYPQAFAYVAAGNPGFVQESLLVSSYDFNTAVNSDLIAYDLDIRGNPVLTSARIMVTGLGATGGAVDPVTGDVIFTTTYGFPNLYVLKGFATQQPAMFGNQEYLVPETATRAHLIVQRQGDVSRGLSLDYTVAAGAPMPGNAVDGVNFSSVSGTLRWAAGNTDLRGIDVPILHDGVFDHARTAYVTLAGTQSAALLTIANHDPKPTVSLSTGDVSVAESAGTIQITATLSQAAGATVTVPFTFTGTATRNRDYSFDLDGAGNPLRTIVIPPGATSGSLNIHITDDALDEDDETLLATIGLPTNATAAGVTRNTVTLVDDDVLPTIAFAAARGGFTEGGSGAGVAVAAVPVRLSAVSGRDIHATVSLSGGTSDGRITVASPLVIPAGHLSAYAVMIGDDSVHEGTKVLSFVLSAPDYALTGAQTTYALTVRDDE